MKSLSVAAIVFMSSLAALAQPASNMNLDVSCVDADGIQTVGSATVDSNTNQGSLTFQYMAQGSPKKTVAVIYKQGSMFQSLVSEDGKIVIANGTSNGESSNNLSVQEMIGGNLANKDDVDPGNCSLSTRISSPIIIQAEANSITTIQTQVGSKIYSCSKAIGAVAGAKGTQLFQLKAGELSQTLSDSNGNSWAVQCAGSGNPIPAPPKL
jgi:hypothetical protein